MLKVKVDNKLKSLNKKQLESYINEYYRLNFQGKCVINKDTQFEICFNAIGRNKTAFGSKRTAYIMTSIKATAIMNLANLIKEAKYIKTVSPKQNHINNFNAISLFIFESKIIIDNIEKKYKITCILNKGGKFHYAINELFLS